MKQYQEMTEEEILRQTDTAIREYLAYIRPHGEFVLDHCLGRQVNELRKLFRQGKGLGYKDKLSAQDARELDVLINHFYPIMLEHARAVQLDYSREEILWKLRSTAAGASIREAFAASGLDVDIECQRHRAKVLLPLGGVRLRFYVGYKSIGKADTLPGLIQAVRDLKDAVSRIGGDVRIEK